MKHFNTAQSRLLLTICLALTLSACTERLYKKALADAAQPNGSKRSFNLTKISGENQNLTWKDIGGERYVLVSSWKADAKYYKNDAKTGFYNTGKYPIWVYPFTQLGYTYDWKRKNKHHVGLSEFVIGKNKKIVVGEVVETAAYLKKGKTTKPGKTK